MKLGDQLQHGGRSRFRVSCRPILGAVFRQAIGMSGGSVYKRRPEPVPARRFTPTAWGFGTGNQLVFVGTLAAFTASNPNIDAPLPPSSSNTPAQRRATREPAPRCFPEPAAILPTSIAILHRTRRHLPPHTGSSPNYPAPPTQISVSAVPARDAGGLRCRAAGWRACAPARRCTPGRACPAGSVRRSTAELRSGRAPAPRRTCRQPTVRKVRRHRNRPAIGGKGVGTVDGRVVACAPWGAVFGVGHVHRGSA
jgi:hypothetical protein